MHSSTPDRIRIAGNSTFADEDERFGPAFFFPSCFAVRTNITGFRTKFYEYEILRPLGDAKDRVGGRLNASLAASVDSNEAVIAPPRADQAPGNTNTIPASREHH